MTRSLKSIFCWKTLRHPNLLRVTGLLRKDGCFGYEMFFMKNGDLHELIGNRGARKGGIRPSELSRWSDELLSGVVHMHERHIMHRDIKPSNILFDHGWSVVLSGFGCACGLPPVGKLPCGRYGTQGFMAPEVDHGELYGSPADVWSISRVVDACVTGDALG